jgi:hypothetical protein
MGFKRVIVLIGTRGQDAFPEVARQNTVQSRSSSIVH